MSKKKLMTRAGFEKMRLRMAEGMAADTSLQKAAWKVFLKGFQHYWIHQATWLGEPLLNLPQDMFAIQDIIYQTKPRIIIEVGVAWGGGTLFYASILEAMGEEGRVIGIDTFIPDDLRKRLASHGKVSKRITLLKGSSVEGATLARLKSLVGRCRQVMVILDSCHTHDHVLKELECYAPLVGKGGYLICGDTWVESAPRQKTPPRPWGPGNSPATARDVFLRKNRDFKIDQCVENKLLFTCNPGGYLRRNR